MILIPCALGFDNAGGWFVGGWPDVGLARRWLSGLADSPQASWTDAICVLAVIWTLISMVMMFVSSWNQHSLIVVSRNEVRAERQC